LDGRDEGGEVKRRRAERATICGVMIALATWGCTGRTYSHSIPVEGDEPVAQKEARASGIVTKERLARLRAELKAEMPDLSDAQLAGMDLSWQKTVLYSFTGKGTRTVVSVVVSLRDGSAADADRILRAASGRLASEVNPREHGDSASVIP
jgi:hypothetical protein